MNVKKIAVIGSGISGLTSAYLLTKAGHDVHLFEKNTRLGGHTHTTPTDIKGNIYNVDSGFIVFNDRTYPDFIRLMDELGVESKETEMSFSTFNRGGNFAYCGKGLNSLFCYRPHLLSPKFWRMLIDIIQFNKRATKDFESKNISSSLSLGEYLKQANYGDWFINRYILPMGSAIWSSSSKDIEAFPALFFIRFFHHHGLLTLSNRPQWRVIKNGSSSYIDAMDGKIGTIHLESAIKRIERNSEKVTIHTEKIEHQFDEVIFACHSDQALAILGECATAKEYEILGDIPYRPNAVSVHQDNSLLPKKRIAFASWNVSLGKLNELPMLTYHMNTLQGFTDCPVDINVSVNCDDEIDDRKMLYREKYEHPIFTAKGIDSQDRHHEISGHNRTHFAGAYWFNGFHEDGVKSAVRVCVNLGVAW